MPVTDEQINEYVYSSEKVIEKQRETIATLRELVNSKNKVYDTLLEYIQKIYTGLCSTDPAIQANALWHLANLADSNTPDE